MGLDRRLSEYGMMKTEYSVFGFRFVKTCDLVPLPDIVIVFKLSTVSEDPPTSASSMWKLWMLGVLAIT